MKTNIKKILTKSVAFELSTKKKKKDFRQSVGLVATKTIVIMPVSK